MEYSSWQFNSISSLRHHDYPRGGKNNNVIPTKLSLFVIVLPQARPPNRYLVSQNRKSFHLKSEKKNSSSVFIEGVHITNFAVTPVDCVDSRCLASSFLRLRVGVTENSRSMAELEFSNVERGAIRSVPDHDLPDHNDDGAWCDDGSLCDDLDLNEGLDISSDLDREWRRRHDQFHTIGYRDGLSAGKEKIAQEGFNDGFKQSVLVGHKWGLVRGVTSALACLPNDLKSKLAGTPETGEKLQNLCNSVGTVSAQDALRFFHAGILASETEEDVSNEIPSYGELGKYIEEFESLVESSIITLHSTDL